MTRIGRTLPDPANPFSIVEYLSRTERIIDGGIEFGSCQDPNDPASTTRANGTTHNGTLVNVTGSFYEAVLTATGKSTISCVHNLNVATTQPATAPNVHWLVFGVIHDGTAADATTTYAVSAWYQGGTRTADAITLGFSLTTAGTAPTVDANHPVVVRLFFVPAVR